MKLELKHLAGYLPYGLKTVNYNTNGLIDKPLISEMIPANILCFTDNSTQSKIILRNLSDLTKEIEVNGEKFVPHLKLGGRPNLKDYDIEYLSKHINDMSFELITKLLEWHFDIYGLIENNLAIDINTL